MKLSVWIFLCFSRFTTHCHYSMKSQGAKIRAFINLNTLQIIFLLVAFRKFVNLLLILFSFDLVDLKNL